MEDRPTRVRRELERATNDANSNVREQLQNIVKGIEAVEDDGANGTPHIDRVAELEEKLAALGNEVDGETHRHVATAEALLYGYRTNLTEN